MELPQSWDASCPVRTVANPQVAVSVTKGTSNNATIFRRIDFPRKRMASPSSPPSDGGLCVYMNCVHEVRLETA
ncbi:hypothetical protein Sm713_46040 [Streptomyces sp. TS71-3]|nr:hypothetical protein Sm713_46040 [Streptomyces sp. TS71-3]